MKIRHMHRLLIHLFRFFQVYTSNAPFTFGPQLPEAQGSNKDSVRLEPYMAKACLMPRIRGIGESYGILGQIVVNEGTEGPERNGVGLSQRPSLNVWQFTVQLTALWSTFDPHPRHVIGENQPIRTILATIWVNSNDLKCIFHWLSIDQITRFQHTSDVAVLCLCNLHRVCRFQPATNHSWIFCWIGRAAKSSAARVTGSLPTNSALQFCLWGGARSCTKWSTVRYLGFHGYTFLHQGSYLLIWSDSWISHSGVPILLQPQRFPQEQQGFLGCGWSLDGENAERTVLQLGQLG